MFSSARGNPFLLSLLTPFYFTTLMGLILFVLVTSYLNIYERRKLKQKIYCTNKELKLSTLSEFSIVSRTNFLSKKKNL